MATKKALVFSTSDINGDGRKDFSCDIGGDRIFTIYDAKNLVLKIAGTAIGGIAAIFGAGFLTM